jgi:hypothetical protein
MYYYRILLLVISSLALSFCKNKSDKPFANCKCGAPRPVFNEALPEYIAGRSFSITNTSGVENIKFKNGTALQIVQTGCNDIKQEFSFSYNDSKFLAYSDAQWIQNAIDEFLRIGSFSDNFSPFKLWGEAILAYKDTFKIAEDKELQKGFFIKIEKIISGNEATMIVTVYADSCG